MTYKLTDEQRAFVLLARELGRQRAAMPDEQRVLLDSPKFNGPVGQLDDGDDTGTLTDTAQETEESVAVVIVSVPDITINKP